MIVHYYQVKKLNSQNYVLVKLSSSLEIDKVFNVKFVDKNVETCSCGNCRNPRKHSHIRVVKSWVSNKMLEKSIAIHNPKTNELTWKR